MESTGKGQRYTVGDLIYYAGLFAGIILVVTTGRPYGFHPILLLIGGIAAGVGLGYGLERLYERSRRERDEGLKDQPFSDEF
jgi:hypothetical protein